MSSIYNDKNTLVQFGCTTYKDRDEFKERLNYKIKNLYNYPCCQLLELLILFSEYIPEDYPELFKDMPNNRLSGCCVLINYQIQEFLRRALIAGSLKVVKEGVRQDALDTYIEPKSAYMLLLSSNIYLSFHGYLETEALKKLVFGDSEKVVTVKKIESPEYTPTYKIDDKNVPDTKTRDTMVLKGNSQQHTSAINHAVSKLFGCTAKEWKTQNPERHKAKENIRDSASINELIVLSNLESINALMNREGLDKENRFKRLQEIARHELMILNDKDFMKSLKKSSDDVYLLEDKDK